VRRISALVLVFALLRAAAGEVGAAAPSPALVQKLCVDPHSGWELDQWNYAGGYLLCSADDPNAGEGPNFKRKSNRTLLFKEAGRANFMPVREVRIVFDGSYLATTFRIPASTAQSLVAGMHTASLPLRSAQATAARSALAGTWSSDSSVPVNALDRHVVRDIQCRFTATTVSCPAGSAQRRFVMTSATEAFSSLSSVNYWRFDLQPDGSLYFRIRENRLWALLYRVKPGAG
jgi:hypothetical protein